MGQISYGDVPVTQRSGGGTKVGFFSLKNDGDEAIVRIMHDDPSTFDICAIHPYQVNGKFRNINCIRDPREEVEKCPLCEAGVRLQYKIFIHLIEYDKDERGNIIPTPKVWERSMAYADQLKDYIIEYGPLSDMIFKIKRSGKAGSQNTTYTILPANASVYRPDLYPKDTSLFDGYTAIGNAIYNTDYNGMQRLLSDDSTQYTPRVSPVTATPVAEYAPPQRVTYQPQATSYEAQPVTPVAPTYGGYSAEPAQEYTPRSAPVMGGGDVGGFARPRRVL